MDLQEPRLPGTAGRHTACRRQREGGRRLPLWQGYLLLRRGSSLPPCLQVPWCTQHAAGAPLQPACSRPLAAQLSDNLTGWPAGGPGASTPPGLDGDDDEQGTQLPAEEEQSLADLMRTLTGSKPVQLSEDEEQSLADLMSSLTGKPVQLDAPLPDGLPRQATG